MDNLFLTVKTIFNLNVQSIATFTVEPFVTKYLRKEYDDLTELTSDNDDDKNDDDDDDDDDDDAIVKMLKLLKSAQVKH